MAWSKEKWKLGGEAYIVYPLVEDSEKERHGKIALGRKRNWAPSSGPLAGLRLTAVHGQMNSEEIQEKMRAFKAKEYDVLSLLRWSK